MATNHDIAHLDRCQFAMWLFATLQLTMSQSAQCQYATVTEVSHSERHPAATGCRDDSTRARSVSREEFPVDFTRGTTRLPDRPIRYGAPKHRTFYRSSEVAVTDQWFATPDRTFTIAYLSDVRVARGSFDPVVVGTSLAAVVVLVVAGASLFKLPPLAWPGMIMVAMVPVGVAAVTARFRPRRYELWARYRGEIVQLFCSTEEKTFGHVCRALIRARERGVADEVDERQYLPAA
jgi:Family of unknown function (DUF6232)